MFTATQLVDHNLTDRYSDYGRATEQFTGAYSFNHIA